MLQPIPNKKKRKVAKGKLSFGLDDEEDGDSGATSSAAPTPPPATPPYESSAPAKPTTTLEDDKDSFEPKKKRLGPNTAIAVAPKAMTKSALLREAQTREQLRKEFLALQESVKATEILIPFVFYDGTNIPGGVCKVKKGDHIWLFLDKSRKVGVELGVGGGGDGERTGKDSRRGWARVGVDDLMLVRGELIIPHVSPLISLTSRERFKNMMLITDYVRHSITSFTTSS
jgi:protein FAM50